MPLRFTIRDLLWLTLVVALAVGWWLDHKRVADRRDQYIRQEIARHQKAIEDSENTMTIIGDLLHGEVRDAAMHYDWFFGSHEAAK
jgi:hypothetical protein